MLLLGLLLLEVNVRPLEVEFPDSLLEVVAELREFLAEE